jgi:hypothetical protein
MLGNLGSQYRVGVTGEYHEVVSGSLHVKPSLNDVGGRKVSVV